MSPTLTGLMQSWTMFFKDLRVPAAEIQIEKRYSFCSENSTIIKILKESSLQMLPYLRVASATGHNSRV